METPLLTRWLGDSDPIFVSDEAAVREARERARSLAAELGVPELADRVAEAAGALGVGQLGHVRPGYLDLREVRRGGVPGIEIVAADRGHGPDGLTSALTEDGELQAVRRLVHELDVELRHREGSCVRARCYAAVPARAWEVGLVGLPHPDEQVNGDDGVCLCTDDGLFVALFDGLGHGPDAARASGAAVEAVGASRDREPAALLAKLEQALAGTVGAAGAVVRLGGASGAVVHGCRGNIATWIGGDEPSRLPCSHGAIGRRGSGRPRTNGARLGPGGLLVMHTDGIRSDFALDGLLAAEGEHPLLLAARIVEGWARDGDDTLVVAVRERATSPRHEEAG